jgi:hypothetical protein
MLKFTVSKAQKKTKAVCASTNKQTNKQTNRSDFTYLVICFGACENSTTRNLRGFPGRKNQETIPSQKSYWNHSS